MTHFHAKCHYDRGPFYLIIAINFWSIRQIFNYYYIFITIGPSFCSNRRVWLECAIWIGHHPRSFFQTLTFYAARNHERIIVNKAMKLFSFPGKRNSESLRATTDKFLFCFSRLIISFCAAKFLSTGMFSFSLSKRTEEIIYPCRYL